MRIHQESIPDVDRYAAKVYKALKPACALFFESTNKFMVSEASGEYAKLPLYGWLPDWARYRFRQAVQGEQVMKLAVDFNRFTYTLLRRTFQEIGFRRVLDVVDLVDPAPMPSLKRSATNVSRAFPPARWSALTFAIPATTFACTN